MRRLVLSQDVKPLSEFRANVATFLQQVHQTNRPLVITQHGKSAAVLLSVQEYETLLEQLEVLQDVHLAETQLAEGKGVSHQKARKAVLERLSR